MTKGDKKKKKEVETQIALLENEFEEKCSLELKDFEAKKKEATVENENLENEPKLADKASKSKKRKEKKDAEAQKRENEIALQEIVNENLPAAIELKKIKEKLLVRGLKIKEVRADGNCLYYAIGEQLFLISNLKKSCEELRELTSDYMLKNQMDFQPYLCSEEDGEPYNDEKYQEYCDNIKNTLMWGSQLELRALSDYFKIKINVIQADANDIILGNESYIGELVITYHRHMYGSGEHYNSTEPLDLDLTDEDNK